MTVSVMKTIFRLLFEAGLHAALMLRRFFAAFAIKEANH